MKNWLAGIAATVIASLVVWWVTKGAGHHHTPPPVSAYMGELLWNTNLQGSDISNLDNSSITTAGACSDACLQNTHCVAMTFVPHPTGGGVCWLKDKVPPSTPRPAYASAIKVFPAK